MTQDRWSQVEELYRAARDPEKRASALAAADPELRREVEALLDAKPAESTVTIAAPLAAGLEFAHYRIEAKLGEGGMGTVYRALDTKLNRPVAIKFLADDLADADARRRFQREAQMASSLNHPHILTVYDAGEHEGRQYLVTEFVDGGTLKDWAVRERRTWRQIIELLTGVADGLAAAHEAKILHRDIKPTNILVAKNGYAKLADFGLAKLAENAGIDLTRTLAEGRTRPGMIVGTIAYMSPEQASGQKLDARSDTFSFGVVLYEMLASKRPFIGVSDLEVLQKVIHQPPEALSEDIPAGLRAAVEKALEKDPADRYQSMRDMVVDLRRLTRQSGVASPAFVARKTAKVKWAAAAVVVLAVAGFWLRMRTPSGPVARSAWVQLTNFADSVTQPALSPDGRILTFIRGPGSFASSGQIYVKLLPNGEPKALTADDYGKMSPVFSPDGSRIAYTARSLQNPWDTWIVPVLGSEPRLWLPNASGLNWSGKNRIVFSEIVDRLEGNHMKIVTAAESRAEERDVYTPQPKGAMAHRSFPSPDGQWTLLAEMTDRGVWQPCRLVPLSGQTVASQPSGHPIGPSGAACLFAAWSPDGRWMYVSSNAGGAYHIWRQRFSEATPTPPEQLTSGPTDEQGIAMEPDGRAFITSVGLQRSSVWIHDEQGERQLSLEGDASLPLFSPDGKTLYYTVLKNGWRELWFTDLASGRSEPFLPDFKIDEGGLKGNFDISPDGKLFVLVARDQDGKSRLWIVRTDRRSPPRPVPNVEGDGPIFARDGEIFFRGREGSYGFAYRVNPDGGGLRKASDYPAIETGAVSPDMKSVVVYARHARSGEEPTGASVILPLNGGPPVRLAGGGAASVTRWSADGKFLYLPLASSAQTFLIRLPAGQVWPPIPAGGFESGTDVLKIPGTRLIQELDVAPSPVPGVYAFTRTNVQRNLYRIPVP